MSSRRNDSEDHHVEDVDDDHTVEENDNDEAYRSSCGGGRHRNDRKRRRSDFIEDVGEEDDDEEEEEDEDDEDDEDYGGRSSRHVGKKAAKKASAAGYFDIEAEVDTDDEEEEEEDGEDDFIVNETVEPHHGSNRVRHIPRDDEDDELDIEALEKKVEKRYGRNRTKYDDDVDEASEVEQQSRLPSFRDPKLWRVKCAIGHEREVAVCLMQKNIYKSAEMQIKSVIALDYVKNYIYVEAYKEAHVIEACKGMRNIYLGTKISLVPIKEMADVLSVESKATDLEIDTWVRIKTGTYKGDLAKVVDVDNVRQKVTVKLIPRIDLQALTDKLNGMQVQKKIFTPPPRFMNVDEARQMNIRVERRRDRMTGDYLDNINGMLFKDGFLHKTVSMKSISSQNIQPSLVELVKFRQPDENIASLSANRNKGHFVKGDRVIVIEGQLTDVKGIVEKVEEGVVYIKSNEKELPTSLGVIEKEVCKYFEPGNHVKVVSGSQEGLTGMVVNAEGHLVNILSDTTKEVVRFFSDNVVECSQASSGINKTEVHDRNANPFPSRVPQLRTTTRPPNFPVRHNGGRFKKDSLIGTCIKIRMGPYKGYRGRVIDVHGTSIRVELESQMNVIRVDRADILDSTNVTTPYRDTYTYGSGSETPMHPSRTPLHPFMTPTRDPRATPHHDGMRTPMRDRAWNPYAAISPPRNVHRHGWLIDRRSLSLEVELTSVGQSHGIIPRILSSVFIPHL